MKKHMISTGTVTYAIKGRDLLRREGYNARIERITSGIGSGGCGYVIILDGGDIIRAEQILRKAGVKILEINEI